MIVLTKDSQPLDEMEATGKYSANQAWILASMPVAPFSPRSLLRTLDHNYRRHSVVMELSSVHNIEAGPQGILSPRSG